MLPERIGGYFGDPEEQAVKAFFQQFIFGYGYMDYYNANTPFWHKDCGGRNDRWMLVWSNRESTQFCQQIKPDDGYYGNYHAGKKAFAITPIITFPPGSIVLFHDQSIFHRTPPERSPDRKFIRIFSPNLEAVRLFQGCHNVTCDGIASLGAAG